MVFVIRNNQQFGPYDEHTLLSYVNSGQILLCDKAKDANSTEETTVRILLKRNGFKAKVSHGGNLVAQLNKIGSELIIPKDSFQKKKWISDKTLLILAAIGLFPSVLSFMPIGGYLVFYLVSLYFAVIWGMFFFSFFKTPQVTIKTTVLVFFLTQFFVFLIWDILGIPALNPFMYMTKLGIPLSLIGFILGVGVSEELGNTLESVELADLGSAKKVVVSNILGQTVANEVLSSDNATIAAPSGVVVVAIEGAKAVKAIVK